MAKSFPAGGERGGGKFPGVARRTTPAPWAPAQEAVRRKAKPTPGWSSFIEKHGQEHINSETHARVEFMP